MHPTSISKEQLRSCLGNKLWNPNYFWLSLKYTFLILKYNAYYFNKHFFP